MGAFVLALAMLSPALAQQSDARDQVHIPVLRKRPPADSAGQTGGQPQPTSTAQQQTPPPQQPSEGEPVDTPPADDPNRPVLRRRPTAEQNPPAQTPSARPGTSKAPQQQAPSQNPSASPTQTGPAGQEPGATTSQAGATASRAGATTAQPNATTSIHDHHAEVMRHGAEAMGFDQQTTTHHFILTRSGGLVRVTVNDPSDAEGVGQISLHMRQVAAQFARGDFNAPERTHGTTPPGVAVMQQMKNKIIYTAHAIEDGAELIISSSDPKAIEAIHRFLEFQIRDHQTGDPVAVR